MYLANNLLYFAYELSFELLLHIALCGDHDGVPHVISFSKCLSSPRNVGNVVPKQ